MNGSKETDRTIGTMFITKTGGLGIEVGGYVVVRPVKKWQDSVILLEAVCHRMRNSLPINAELRDRLKEYMGLDINWKKKE